MPARSNRNSPALSRLALVVVIAAAFLTALPARAVPSRDWSAAGPFKVAVTEDSWRDSSRSRDIPVRIYAPVSAPGLSAVVVFSHGLGGNRQAGETWGRQWASWGFVSVHIQHPGSDTQAIRDGTGTVTQRAKAAMTVEQLQARAQDAVFVATEIARRAAAGVGPFANVDAKAIGFSGHSFGAKTTLAVAGETFPATLTPMSDPRYKAFIAFSPMSRTVGDLNNAFGSIKAPFLSLTGSQDTVEALTPSITPENRTLPFQHMARGDKYLGWLDTATHKSFGGQGDATKRRFKGLAGEPQTPPNQPHIDAVVKATTTAFWLAYLTPTTDVGREAKAWLDRGGPKEMLASADRWETR
ncbi:MAG TPA: hypothetical protein VGK19_20950 [Capsulimonadaceae bacterium]|jgi:predicted dienelactone hydrolase